MVRNVLPVLLMVLATACGGRDPLVGALDDNGLPAAGSDGGSQPGTARDGGPGTTPPAGGPDAGQLKPPLPVSPDAAVPSKTDAQPADPKCQFPACIQKIQFSCMPAGSCMQQLTMSNGGIATNICYANGVKQVISIMGGRTQSTNIRFFNADGTSCFSIEPQQGRGGGVNALTYRDAGGNVVANATLDGGLLSITCVGQSTPQVVPATCQPGVMRNGGPSCTNGTCN
jgi:hypothetical protein